MDFIFGVHKVKIVQRGEGFAVDFGPDQQEHCIAIRDKPTRYCQHSSDTMFDIRAFVATPNKYVSLSVQATMFSSPTTFALR